LPGRRVTATPVRSYRTISTLPGRLAAAVGGVFLWHFPAGFPGSALPTILPCDVRTFLEGRTSAAARSASRNPSRLQRYREHTSKILSDLPKTLEEMYDVVYIDAHGGETPVAQHLDDRGDAADVARKAAAERGVGRMVLPGSSKLTNCVCVIPVPAPPAPAP
jgi:hypothetical protein